MTTQVTMSANLIADRLIEDLLAAADGDTGQSRLPPLPVLLRAAADQILLLQRVAKASGAVMDRHHDQTHDNQEWASLAAALKTLGSELPGQPGDLARTYSSMAY
jgi:hypothetical protein